MATQTNAEDKRKHLEMIQAVITRMASNSFLFKGWSITLIAAISAFAVKDTNSALMTIPLVSTLLFWAIDAYYLMLERAFRNVYNAVATKDPADIDFRMTPAKDDKTFVEWLKVLLKRPVLIGFYGTVLIMLVILIMILNNVKVTVEVTHGA